MPQQPGARPTSNTHEATTVRNLVNLKKQTLRLAPKAGSPGTLEISFALDVVSVCRCAACGSRIVSVMLTQHGHGLSPSDCIGRSAFNSAVSIVCAARWFAQGAAYPRWRKTVRLSRAEVMKSTKLHHDATLSCRVSIFLIAQEDNSTGAITAKKVICDGADCPVGVRAPACCAPSSRERRTASLHARNVRACVYVIACFVQILKSSSEQYIVGVCAPTSLGRTRMLLCR